MTAVGDPRRLSGPWTRSSRSSAKAWPGWADGEHFFDLPGRGTSSSSTSSRSPGYPRRVSGRQAVAELYRPYGATFCLDRCYEPGRPPRPGHGRRRPRVRLAGPRRPRPEPPYSKPLQSRCCRSPTARSSTGGTTLDPLAVFDAIGWPRRGKQAHLAAASDDIHHHCTKRQSASTFLRQRRPGP